MAFLRKKGHAQINFIKFFLKWTEGYDAFFPSHVEVTKKY